MKKTLLIVMLIAIWFTQGAWFAGWQQDDNLNNLTIGGKITTFQGTKPTVSNCGTSPAVSTDSTDVAGSVLQGTASPTTCKVIFNGAYSKKPICVVNEQNGTAALGSTTDTTAIYIISAAGMGQTGIQWNCVMPTN
jgi:hypothetical protein